jgi:hypothetical protein
MNLNMDKILIEIKQNNKNTVLETEIEADKLIPALKTMQEDVNKALTKIVELGKCGGNVIEPTEEEDD